MKDIEIGSGVLPVYNTSVKNDDVRKKSSEEEKLRKACADFESLLVYSMLQTMRKTVPSADSSLKSFGKDTYNMMFDQKIAEEISKRGAGIGLQAILFNQLKKQPTNNEK